jgi:hypothetical protein
MKHIKRDLSILSKRVLYIFMHLIAITHLQSCFLKQDRTTTVYGTITDQNGEPVDSILVTAQGSKHVKYEIFDEAFTDETGHYELVADVPRQAHSVNVVIPFSLNKNPKFGKHFKDYLVFKNEIRTLNCCNLDIGGKTRYDFQLIAK